MILNKWWHNLKTIRSFNSTSLFVIPATKIMDVDEKEIYLGLNKWPLCKNLQQKFSFHHFQVFKTHHSQNVQVNVPFSNSAIFKSCHSQILPFSNSAIFKLCLQKRVIFEWKGGLSLTISCCFQIVPVSCDSNINSEDS